MKNWTNRIGGNVLPDEKSNRRNVGIGQDLDWMKNNGMKCPESQKSAMMPRIM